METLHHIKAISIGLMLSSTVVPVVMAEDTEIYTTVGSAAAVVKPNILFIVDGSSDMLATSETTEAYDPGTNYGGDCSTSNVYFTSDGSEPDCAGNGANAPDYFNFSALACNTALVTTEFVLDGDGLPTIETRDVPGPLLSGGIFSGRLAHYGSTGNGNNAVSAWVAVSVSTNAERSYTVECRSDRGVHGETTGNAGTYIDDADKYSATEPASPHPIWSDNASLLTLFHGNYINYKNASGLTSNATSFFDQAKEAIISVVEGNTQVNIGLMVLDQSSPSSSLPISEGGGIRYAVQDGSLPRGNFIPQLRGLNADGNTPLSEAYYEALLYYGGEAVDYGTGASPPLVGSATGTGNTDYISPIDISCQTNYIVVASNGKATDDELSAARQANLPGFTAGQCKSELTVDDTSDDNLSAQISDATDDNCLDELSYWAANNDVATIAGNTAHVGEQTVKTYTVGFGYGDLADQQQIDGKKLLEDTAIKGGGKFKQAENGEQLRAALIDIINDALMVNSTFTSPAVSVNAFNRSTHLDDLYFTLFKPTSGSRWEGNLKKYKLKFVADTGDQDDDGDTTEKLPIIADQTGTDAIDPDTGFFRAGTTTGAWSIWSAGVDGDEVALGGAANELVVDRDVYTFTGTYEGIAPAGATGALSVGDANKVLDDPDVLTDALLDITTEVANEDEIIVDTPYRTTLINWARGLDALSKFGEVDIYDDVRPQMGDPLHSEPALVQYGQTTTTDGEGNDVVSADLVAYVATNDGYLHAFDVDDGTEIFSFIPQELLPNLKISMENTGGDKLYGLDGNVVAWVHDDDGDNAITAGGNDHVYLYIGMRRGGNNIYALNVTNRDAPVLMWVIKGGEGDYGNLGQTWSTVNVEKVMDGTDPKTVLIFGGGYDTSHDTAAVRPTDGDAVGDTVYIADATTGAFLWSAEAGANVSGTMKYSIPARVKPLDISADGFIDRLYAVDMGGQIFRFDIDNTNSTALSASITGGRIADLAIDSSDELTAENARRFFYPPDAALVDAPDGAYHALVISSGHRANPLSDTIHDRMYMIKDRNTGLLTDNAQYTYADGGALGALTEAELRDVTVNLAGGEGVSAGGTTQDDELAAIRSADGWYINLSDEDNSDAWIGEKGLAEPLIIEGVVIISTYTPPGALSPTSCTPSIGLGKVFFLDVLDGTAAFPSSVDARVDRHQDLVRSGIPPSPNVIITDDAEPTLCLGTECRQAEFGLGIRKTYWYEVN